MSLYLKPRTLDEAVSLLAGSDAQILSGGTDFYPALGEKLPQGTIVDVSSLQQLRGISISAEHIRIGGLTTWTDIIRAPLPRCFDALKGAAREVGSVQIQNRGTVAGNLCNASPAADGVPPLLALDAQVELVSLRGRRQLPLEHFIAGPRRTELAADEILTAVVCPAPPTGRRSTFLKLGARRYLVISIAMVAVGLDIEDGIVRAAQLAVGACSAVAMRLPAAERR